MDDFIHLMPRSVTFFWLLQGEDLDCQGGVSLESVNTLLCLISQAANVIMGGEEKISTVRRFLLELRMQNNPWRLPERSLVCEKPLGLCSVINTALQTFPSPLGGEVPAYVVGWVL